MMIWGLVFLISYINKLNEMMNYISLTGEREGAEEEKSKLRGGERKEMVREKAKWSSAQVACLG